MSSGTQRASLLVLFVGGAYVSVLFGVQYTYALFALHFPLAGLYFKKYNFLLDFFDGVWYNGYNGRGGFLWLGGLYF